MRGASGCFPLSWVRAQHAMEAAASFFLRHQGDLARAMSRPSDDALILPGAILLLHWVASEYDEADQNLPQSVSKLVGSGEATHVFSDSALCVFVRTGELLRQACSLLKSVNE